MTERKPADVIYTNLLSPILQIVRIAPEKGSTFPEYNAGQHIALSRDHCKLTKRVTDEFGQRSYVYDIDEVGNIKRGQVTHSYSIASAPYETKQYGYLEFYIALEEMAPGQKGRLTESLFDIEPGEDNIHYMDRIVGDFTLEKRAAGMTHLVMVGTGTGLAPFASMIKQLHYESKRGIHHPYRITLFHTNRTIQELAYVTEFQAIEAAKKIDFVYVPTTSRPVLGDTDASMGAGRANNVLRSLLDLPVKEEEDLERAKKEGRDTKKEETAIKKVALTKLPSRFTKNHLVDRMPQSTTVIMTCGNIQLMDDIQNIASQKGYTFEKEEW